MWQRSRVSLSRRFADIATITSYHRVIDHFHRRCTVFLFVLALCLIVRLRSKISFKTEGSRYKKLLEELQGRVEMGIRVIVADQKQSPETLLAL